MALTDPHELSQTCSNMKITENAVQGSGSFLVLFARNLTGGSRGLEKALPTPGKRFGPRDEGCIIRGSRNISKPVKHLESFFKLGTTLVAVSL